MDSGFVVVVLLVLLLVLVVLLLVLLLPARLAEHNLSVDVPK